MTRINVPAADSAGRTRGVIASLFLGPADSDAAGAGTEAPA